MAIKFIGKDALAKQKPRIPFPKDFRLSDHLRELVSAGGSSQRVYEFIGSDSFSDEWNQRQQFEVDAGRDEEPILYTSIYDVINDPNLPEVVNIYKIGPGGVIFEEIFEGGEVKFATVGSSQETVRIRHYGVGLEYTKDLVVYNRLWDVAIHERQAGIAYNALLNHVHLNPILAYSYGSANQTAAVTSGATLQEDYLLTLEAAITAARTDTSNPRRGPYNLLVSSANLFSFEKALSRVPQFGVDLQAGSAISAVQNVIAYDGWTGTRGGKSVSYAGVTANKAYLVDTANKMLDFKSYMKQDLRLDGEQMDASRFTTQRVYDTYFGVYANPLRSVEEITLPT
jgi:hypothetical protein